MNLKTFYNAQWCPKCHQPWGRYGTLCENPNCYYQRPFLVWLRTGAWPLGVILGLMILWLIITWSRLLIFALTH